MLSDRPYMRGDYPREKTSVVTWLICSILAGFFLQLAASASWLGGSVALDDLLALSIRALREGRWWTVVTHSFLHDTRYIFHGLASVLMLFFLGREVLPVLGPRRFLGLYLGATVAGALAWSAVHWRTGGAHMGAMAGADAMLVIFACFYPNRPLDVLLLFVPISIRPKHLAWAVGGFAAFWLLFFEMRGAAQPFGRFAISGAAQLGGMAAGWFYFRFLHEARWRREIPRAELDEPPLAELAPVATPAPRDAPAAAAESRQDLRARVDRVLDKINSHGFGSLTPEEKRLLDEAKDLLGRR